MLNLKCFYRKSIFAKCTQLACLLSFASLFHHDQRCWFNTIIVVIWFDIWWLLTGAMSTVQFPADSRQFLWKLSRPLKRSKLSRTRRRGIIHWWPQPLFNILSFSDHHCQGVVSNSLAGALRHNLVTRSTWGVTVSNLTAAFSPRSASHQLVTRVNRVIASSATISSFPGIFASRNVPWTFRLFALDKLRLFSDVHAVRSRVFQI